MDNLTVSVSKSPFNKDVTLLTVKGSLDTNTISEFERNFRSVLGENRFRLVVDLREAHYISSAGWGLFVSEIRRIRGEKGDLVLAGMLPDVLEVFELLQFNTILKFFPDVETAVNRGFEGLPSLAGKTRSSKNQLKKAEDKAARPEPSGEPLAAASLEGTPKSDSPPEPVAHKAQLSYWGRVFRDWGFWGLVLLAALAACLVAGDLAWHAGALPHWAGGAKTHPRPH